MDGTKNEFLYKGFGLKIEYFNKTEHVHLDANILKIVSI